MVRGIMASDVRCHIGKDDIRLSVEELKESLHGSIIGDVPGYSGDSGERFDGTKVDTDDESFLPYALLGDLKPSAGRRTKIHDPVTLLEDIETIVDLWITEQHHMTESAYYFKRPDCRWIDTLHNDGRGYPVNYTGMTWSGFRPSDDACVYGYLVPANLFAATVLGYVAEFAGVYNDAAMAERATKLAKEIREGVEKYGVVEHEKFGKMYAYETDGNNNYTFMDDANVPSLMSLPWLRACSAEDEIYKNTRSYVLSKENPFYFEGTAAKGVGSPHTPEDYVWHIALSMQGLTSIDEAEKTELLKTLLATDAGTGYMHEGFHCDRPEEFTRDWFAWSNSLFALYVLEYFGL